MRSKSVVLGTKNLHVAKDIFSRIALTYLPLPHAEAERRSPLPR